MCPSICGNRISATSARRRHYILRTHRYAEQRERERERREKGVRNRSRRMESKTALCLLLRHHSAAPAAKLVLSQTQASDSVQSQKATADIVDVSWMQHRVVAVAVVAALVVRLHNDADNQSHDVLSTFINFEVSTENVPSRRVLVESAEVRVKISITSSTFVRLVVGVVWTPKFYPPWSQN